jgi:hypothetical protein
MISTPPPLDFCATPPFYKMGVSSLEVPLDLPSAQVAAFDSCLLRG